MTVDTTALERLTRLKAGREISRGGGSSGVGGGEEPPHHPGMEPRIAKLEASSARIEVTLAEMAAHMKHLATTESVQVVRTEIAMLVGKLDAKATAESIHVVRTDIATLTGVLNGKATATDLAELRGRVGRIPTVPVLAGLLAVATAIITTWPWVVAHLHLR